MSNIIMPDQRDALNKRWGALQLERESWVDHWQEISRYLMPRNGRFMLTDRNKGDKRSNSILDSSGTRALRILGAGLMGGATSPARPWFRLAVPDDDLMKFTPVKLWLAECTKTMLYIFQQTNVYRALHSMYEEMGAFGTAAALVMDDYDRVMRIFNLTAGEYAIATDYKGEVVTMYREFQATVGQIVREFGKEKCSNTVQNLWENGNLDAWVTLVHAIEPRYDRDPSKRDALNMPWKSTYFEQGQNQDKYLRESGFRQFRGLTPRWSVAGGDVYGNGPGMEALGDVKQLQHQQLRKAEAIDYMTKPPLQIPSSLKNQDVRRMPGGNTFVDPANPAGGIKTMFETNLNLNYLLEDIRDVRERVNGAFYTDLFLMLSGQDMGRMTATEVAERHEEKLLMLGPVLERLHNELLDPLITMTFQRMIEIGLVPPPPEELQGMELNVDFVSMLAQAQRAVSTNAVDRYVANLGQIATFKPDVLDKFDADKWADSYGDMLGVDPELIVGGEQVALIRNERAKQQAQAQAMQAANVNAQTAKTLGDTPTNNKNALTDVISQFSGYTTPQGL